MIKNNIAIDAEPVEGLEHGDIGLTEDNMGIKWLVLECDNERIAIEVANRVINLIWL